MRSTIERAWPLLLVGTLLVPSLDNMAIAAPPTAPKVSTFAPADDLVNQLDYFLGRLEKAVQSEAEYKDAKDKVGKDANTAIVIALALGLHDTDNKYKTAAPAIMKAAQGLASADDFASATKGVAAVKAAVAGKGDDPIALKWEKVASLEELMKQVPLVNTKLKRYTKKASRFKSRAKDIAGYSAVLATIAQGVMADTHEAKNPGEVEKWYNFCVQMRDAAAAVNTAIRAGDKKTSDAAMKTLAQSCEDCHEIFHPEAEEEKEEGEEEE